VQGGAFSETGSIFYCVVGICDASYGSDGIQAFDTSTWRRVKQSARCPEDSPLSGCPPSCPDFRFWWWEGIWVPYYTTCGLGAEPEGLDVWDLDNDPRSTYPGQLHVARLYNVGGQDDVTIFHYTHFLYADSSWGGDKNGSKGHPYNTLEEASACAWDGAVIKMNPGNYNEALTIAKRVQLISDGTGTVVIGTTR
jgi:hypothetical protein